MESRSLGVLDTPLSRSMTSPYKAHLRDLFPSAQPLQHQLHRHQHGIVAADQPAFGNAAGVVDQSDIERGFQRAAGAGGDDAGSDREFSREWLDNIFVGEARADGRADAAVNFRADD